MKKRKYVLRIDVKEMDGELVAFSKTSDRTSITLNALHEARDMLDKLIPVVTEGVKLLDEETVLKEKIPQHEKRLPEITMELKPVKKQVRAIMRGDYETVPF